MKNKGLIAVVFVFAFLLGSALLVGSASTVKAYDDYGYDTYGYDDYGYSGYDTYGYDDYGYGGYDTYGYDDYGYDTYGYDDCYDCYDYGYDDCYDCYDYGNYDYGYDDCYYDCGGSYTYDRPTYSGCWYNDCGNTYVPPTRPIQPVQPTQPNIDIRNENNNNTINKNDNVNNNNNNIVVKNYVGGYSEPTRNREVARADDSLVCTPASQSSPINQTVSLRVSGGSGNYAWSAPGSQNLSGRGDSVSLRYPSAGLKTITVSSGGQTATCFVQVTGGQVLAEFIELPNTGAGGIHAILPNVIALGGGALAVILGLVFFVRRAIIA